MLRRSPDLRFFRVQGGELEVVTLNHASAAGMADLAVEITQYGSTRSINAAAAVHADILTRLKSEL